MFMHVLLFLGSLNRSHGEKEKSEQINEYEPIVDSVIVT